MLASPWNLILTVVFAFTGVYCLVRLIAHRPPPGARRGTRSSTPATTSHSDAKDAGIPSLDDAAEEVAPKVVTPTEPENLAPEPETINE